MNLLILILVLVIVYLHKLLNPIIKPKNKDIFLKINRIIDISERNPETLRKFISYILGGFNYQTQLRKPFVNHLLKQIEGNKAFIAGGTHEEGMFLFLYIENKDYITCKISTPDLFLKKISN